jgi:uncharacterized coiled-coil DUF342 family protein
MKHIRKFNESNEIDISSERISEINKELKDIASLLEEKVKFTESLMNELNNYKKDSMKGNDQIDDSIAALQIIKKDIENCFDKIDTVVNNLEDYNDSGRKYIYEI